MKTLFKLILISVLSFVGISCNFTESEKTIESGIKKEIKSITKNISVEEYKKLIGEDAIILDVRRKIEYEAGHIKGAINIDWFDEGFMAKVNKLDKTKKLLIHCASGGRSYSAMTKLKDSGFPELYNMLGGFNAWKSAGYEYEK